MSVVIMYVIYYGTDKVRKTSVLLTVYSVSSQDGCYAYMR